MKKVILINFFTIVIFIVFFEFVLRFNVSLGIPKRLSEIGVTYEEMDSLVDMALKDPSCDGNPVQLTNDNVHALFKDCI